MKPTYTIRRLGRFTANLNPCGQCGSEGQREFGYVIEANASELDGGGFVLDNRQVPAIAFGMVDNARFSASCEDLAALAICNLVNALDGRATRVFVRVLPNPDSQIELTWREGESLPERLPRLVGETLSSY